MLPKTRTKGWGNSRRFAFASILLVALVCPPHSPGFDLERRFFLGGGTPGIELGALVKGSEDLSIRLGAGAFFWTVDQAQKINGQNFSSQVGLRLFSVPLTFEFSTSLAWLKLAGGIVLNFNSILLRVSPEDPRGFGNIVFSPEQQGSVTTMLDFFKVAPYGGFVFKKQMGKPFLNFSGRLGLMYQGPPSASRIATGMLAPSAGKAEDFEKILREHKYLQFFPMLSLAVEIRLPLFQGGDW